MVNTRNELMSRFLQDLKTNAKSRQMKCNVNLYLDTEISSVNLKVKKHNSLQLFYMIAVCTGIRHLRYLPNTSFKLPNRINDFRSWGNLLHKQAPFIIRKASFQDSFKKLLNSGGCSTTANLSVARVRVK